MAKHASAAVGWGHHHLQKRWLLALLLMLTVSTVIAFFIRAAFDSCDRNVSVDNVISSARDSVLVVDKRAPQIAAAKPSPLSFMKSKIVLLVSHELSLSGSGNALHQCAIIFRLNRFWGSVNVLVTAFAFAATDESGPLLLMELAFLLRSVGAEVNWVTFMKPSETDEVIYSLEHKMLDRGVQVLSAFGKEAIDTALRADLVVLNTAVAGKWLDYVLKEDVHRVLPKVLWWIHEMRGHYFKLEYVKHLPSVAGAMIDSHVTAEYWKNRTHERLKIKMPETYVVHLGNSNELMQVAEDSVAKRVLREHVRESLGVRNDDLLFALINSVSRGKGQDLFLRSFYEALQLIKQKKMQVPPLHAVIVGSDMSAHTKLEMELRDYVTQKKIQDRVHFVNKTLTVAPYLAAVDVLVQNSQPSQIMSLRITKIPRHNIEQLDALNMLLMETCKQLLGVKSTVQGIDMKVLNCSDLCVADELLHIALYTLRTPCYSGKSCFKQKRNHKKGRGECFGRITIEAMAFQLPVLGTAAGGTMEIVVNGTTGLLHPAGKEGVITLVKHIVKLATHVERRLTIGKRGYERVKERFLEHHMAERIGEVLKEVLRKSKIKSSKHL
ncbi:UDP-Glycosyltransferase superfamily protein [Gossypium australe]|uniref:UDP-Glycosyltransferase superfamily protein n=1 Tax=Gossypium australe TaxID=47621 RepID=A0A5B6VZS4_9ROSI|nr:UDP-Glycosyltransferase superfamily protein [Gossypium australe]